MRIGVIGPEAVRADVETGRRRGFAVATAILGLFLAAASAPSPLYAVYAMTWHFSATDLTAVFAVYALALLATLLLAGSLSDDVGRRPVLLAGLGLLGISLLVFIAAGGLPALYAARITQGTATGLITSAVAAALIDLQPPDRPGLGPLVNAVTPTFGLAAGALLAGALVQYAPAPTRLIYAVLLLGVILLAASLAVVPETVRERRPPRLRVRLGMEPHIRRPYLAVLPCLVATWALGGLYLSLGPSIAYGLQHTTNRLVGGVVVALLAGTGGVAALAVNRWPAPRAMLVGCAALATGVLITVAGIATTVPALFYAGTIIAGAGFGAGFLGAFRTLVVLATPSKRSQLAAAVYIAAYLAFSLPAVIAGVLATHLGLRTTAIGYGLVVAALALTALALTGGVRRDVDAER